MTLETYMVCMSSLLKLTSKSDRIRVLPPYREHLSQAFARFFMRVGLPQDIKIKSNLFQLKKHNQTYSHLWSSVPISPNCLHSLEVLEYTMTQVKNKSISVVYRFQ